eukprot:scaffold132790_cov19-Tisochrysis_lutea.AAC.1
MEHLLKAKDIQLVAANNKAEALQAEVQAGQSKAEALQAELAIRYDGLLKESGNALVKSMVTPLLSLRWTDGFTPSRAEGSTEGSGAGAVERC